LKNLQKLKESIYYTKGKDYFGLSFTQTQYLQPNKFKKVSRASKLTVKPPASKKTKMLA